MKKLLQTQKRGTQAKPETCKQGSQQQASPIFRLQDSMSALC